jgi:prepilin-type N-terminal cleavage/methylation domain-containing protein
MLMWETGRDAGFTLLEVLAVIVLLGLVMTWAVPSLLERDEPIAVNHIRALLESDLQLLKDEARSGQTERKIVFTEEGYKLQLADQEVVRDFQVYHFAFRTAGESTESIADGKKSFPTLVIQPDGLCSNLAVDWETTHLSGGLDINDHRTFQWSFKPR